MISSDILYQATGNDRDTDKTPYPSPDVDVAHSLLNNRGTGFPLECAGFKKLDDLMFIQTIPGGLPCEKVLPTFVYSR
ncbi:hypothetical protein [Nostoc sp.]|uniref:hypothetical protein n=1 Tax=Nostoc sp. TaxID=1180 RepID=UPI002FF9BDF8